MFLNNLCDIIKSTSKRGEHPRLASEWNYEKNSVLKPEDFTANSGKKVWWKCKYGHEWEAVINNRNKGTGCPECYKARRKRRKNTT